MPFKPINRLKKLSPAAVAAGVRQYSGSSNRLEVLNEGDTECEIHLSGSVGKSWWDEEGISEKEVRDAIDSVPKGKKITFHVNSEGGSVQDGLGIYNKIKSRAEDITCRISGYALSIASVFPLAAGRVVSPKSAVWMIHKAWNYAGGNADEMRRNAEMLDQHDQTLAEIYADVTGKTKDEMLSAMASETWIRGSQAVEYGLADEGDDEEETTEEDVADKIHPEFLARCKNLSPEVLNMLKPKEKQLPANSTATKDNENMNKKIVVALLKKHGITATEAETEDQLQAKLDAIPVKTETDKQGADSVLANQLAQIQAQLASEKRSRISARIDGFIGEQRITNAEREDAINRSVNDETYLTVLAARPAVAFGPDAIGHRIEIVAENPLEKIRSENKTAAARYAAMNGEKWKPLYDDACARDLRSGKQVLAANTYSSTLVTSFLMDGSVTDLKNRWAMLKSFSIDTSPDQYKPLATGVLKHVTAGGTVQTDATNFESGNSTVAPVSVTMHQYSVAFQVSNSDLNSGLRMQDLVTINTANFANKIIEVATAPITAAIFTETPLVSAPAAFGFSDMATLQAQLKKSPIMNLILDGDYIARIANVPGFFQQAGTINGGSTGWKAYGWDGIYINTDWTGAGTNVRGFACNPQAIAGILGLPLTPPNIPGGIFSTGTMIVPGLDTSVMTSSWFNPATRTMWSGLDIMAGFKEVDTTAGVIVTSQ